MQKLLCVLVFLSLSYPTQLIAQPLLYDDFLGDIVSRDRWHIPTWVSGDDGTYIGRTQFRCTQNSGLPEARNSNALIALDTYNPTGYSFYGTDLISNQNFEAGKGLHITVRAKMNTTTRGIVGGIFLYSLKPGSNTLHDEIDFELLTNRPNEVQTNIYDNEPLGTGHPKFFSYKSGTITDYHSYEIKWTANRVSWFVDGELIRTESGHVPRGPMRLHFNIWAPDNNWPEAFDGALQVADTKFENKRFIMLVDTVEIKHFEPTVYIPAIQLLLLK